MKQSIELFSGSGQISQIFEEHGFKSFTVDYNKRFNPALCCDIQTLQSSSLPSNVFLFWASPDCSKLSRAAAQRHWIKKTISYRNYEYIPLTLESIVSLNLVARTVDLIKELQPVVWFIENPVGRIHHTAAMRSIGHYRYAVNYADWGFPYSKETFIFTNQLLPLPTIVQKRHCKGLRTVNNSYNRSLVPPALIRFLLSHSSIK